MLRFILSARFGGQQYQSRNRTCILTSNLHPIREIKIGRMQKAVAVTLRPSAPSNYQFEYKLVFVCFFPQVNELVEPLRDFFSCLFFASIGEYCRPSFRAVFPDQ